MSGIVSGEGVAIDLARAGVGTRVVAALIDLVVEFVAFVVLMIVGLATVSGDAAGTAFVIICLVAVFGGYPVVCEWLSGGKTLGKLALGIRAVRDDGGPIGFRQALVRGLLGLVLEKPGLFFPLGTSAALLTMIFSSSDKRIGDLLAGTFVVSERTGSNAAAGSLEQLWVPPELVGWAESLDLTRLDDRLALSVRQFVMRAGQMTPAAQVSLGEQLRAQVLAVVAPQPPYGVPTPLVLTTVLAERRRRATPSHSRW